MTVMMTGISDSGRCLRWQLQHVRQGLAMLVMAVLSYAEGRHAERANVRSIASIRKWITATTTKTTTTTTTQLVFILIQLHCPNPLHSSPWLLSVEA